MPSEFGGIKFEEAEIKAEETGCEIFLGSPVMLQFDLDTPESVVRFNDMWARYASKFPQLRDQVPVFTESKSGKVHAHVRATSPMSIESRLIIQASFGSDGQREILSYLNHLSGERDGTSVLLFERPSGAAKIRALYETTKSETVSNDDFVPF